MLASNQWSSLSLWTRMGCDIRLKSLSSFCVHAGNIYQKSVILILSFFYNIVWNILLSFLLQIKKRFHHYLLSFSFVDDETLSSICIYLLRFGFQKSLLLSCACWSILHELQLHEVGINVSFSASFFHIYFYPTN